MNGDVQAQEFLFPPISAAKPPDYIPLKATPSIVRPEATFAFSDTLVAACARVITDVFAVAATAMRIGLTDKVALLACPGSIQ
jgi:hypothetical protein